MWVANDTTCLHMEADWFNDALFVFNGEATCCRLNHPMQLQCDREALVLPILGLFGELYAGKESSVEKKKLWEVIETQKHLMFPSQFSFVFGQEKSGKGKDQGEGMGEGENKDKGGTQSETRDLFGELIGLMEDHVDKNTKARKQLIKSSSSRIVRQLSFVDRATGTPRRTPSSSSSSSVSSSSSAHGASKVHADALRLDSARMLHVTHHASAASSEMVSLHAVEKAAEEKV